MADQRQPWEQMEGEPSMWFGRFDRYRLMPPSERSMLAAYAAEVEAQKGAKKRSGTGIPQAWRDAAIEWNWKQRAEAWDAYDREQQREAREQAYRDAVEQHQRNAQMLAQRALISALALWAKTDERVAQLKASEIKPGLIPAFIRAAASAAEEALQGEAQALSVEQLLKLLDGGTNGNSSNS